MLQIMSGSGFIGWHRHVYKNLSAVGVSFCLVTFISSRKCAQLCYTDNIYAASCALTPASISSRHSPASLSVVFSGGSSLQHGGVRDVVMPATETLAHF